MSGAAQVHVAGGSSPHGHRHQVADEERRTLIAFGVTAVFMLVEAVGGLVSGSLALLADAAHMLADVFALLMAWGAFRLGRLAADQRRSYGYRRLEVLAALANGITVIGLSVWIVYEAGLRLAASRPVEAWPMLAVAVVGLVANLVTFRVLDQRHAHAQVHAHGDGSGHADHVHNHRHEGNLNLQGAALHVLGDLLGSLAAVIAAAVILSFGWTPIDPILSVAIALLIVVSGVKVVASATHILLEGAPKGFDPARLREALLAEVAGLKEVHHLHAWSVTSGEHLLTLHAVVDRMTDRDDCLAAIKQVLAEDFGFTHSVVQMEAEGCEDRGTRCG